MCATDCGRCIDCIETDDYAPTWRNPRFQSPTDRPPAAPVSGPLARAGAETASVHVEALVRDGGER